MRIIFTKTGERTYSTVVHRDDRVTLQVPGFDRPTWLPHDIAHYIIELELGLSQGFWGRVAEGAVFSGMAILEGRQHAHASTRSRQLIKEAPQNGTEAEVLVGLLLKITQERLENNRGYIQPLLKSVWQPNHPDRPNLQPGDIERICRKLREMQYTWAGLAIGESLEVTWPTANSRKRPKAQSRRK